MSYNNVKDSDNPTRKRKKIRQEKRDKREQKEDRIKEALLKSKQDGTNPTKVEGYGLDESNEVVKLW